MLSVQFSCSVVSDPLQPHEPQHARSPCPSPTPRVHPNPCPLSQWCHPTILSSVAPFSSCPQSFPASGSFQMSQFFASGGQSIGVSPSAWVIPMNTQDWSPLGWTGWISLQSKGLSRVFSNRRAYFPMPSLQWSRITEKHVLSKDRTKGHVNNGLGSGTIDSGNQDLFKKYPPPPRVGTPCNHLPRGILELFFPSFFFPNGSIHCNYPDPAPLLYIYIGIGWNR